MRQAIATITQDTLQKFYPDMKFRLSFVVREQRLHFEHF